mmetsp:Transcript_33274/g.86278  ORF Transcript_33274/g.86278 Transcript_33274/m.86278 type:complete len:160 (+) Transcript_33274:1-480(+)
MSGDADEAARYARLQIARWKSTVGEVEALLGNCMHVDEKLEELSRRCRGPEGSGKSDLESGQEAFVRSRMQMAAAAAASAGGGPTPLGVGGIVKTKTQKERKMELLELRHELAKATSSLEVDSSIGDHISENTSPPTSPLTLGKPRNKESKTSSLRDST